MKIKENYWIVSPKLLIAVSLIALLLLLSVYIKAYLSYDENTLKWFVNLNTNEKTSPAESLGATGDYVGGLLNPVLSFFSFLALLITIQIQVKELINSREELKRSADAQKESANALKIQNTTSELSKFENTFFNLINLHNDILRSLSTDTVRHTSAGTSTLSSPIKRTLRKVRSYSDIASAREYLLNEQDDIDQYFRIVYQILKLVDQTIIFPKDAIQNKKFYSNILRAIVDQDALELIAINAADINETSIFANYKNLIEVYSFLEHLKPDAQKSQFFIELKKTYSSSAFGESIHFNQRSFNFN